LRVVLSILEIAAFFAAAVYLPLADIITFYLAAPIFVTVLSAFLLGEQVDISVGPRSGSASAAS
jgi:drug/metabolite transporter (DMT)-like permease